jgi:hypothetical protein
MASIGSADYRLGAKERLEEAFTLLRKEQLAGSIYLAGRAVEGMLRAVIWKGDPEYATGKKYLNTGHDLRDMLILVKNLGILRNNSLRESLAADVQKVGRLWSNNMRFLPTGKIRTMWYDLGEVYGKRTLRAAADEYCDACSAIIKRCEALWQPRQN